MFDVLNLSIRHVWSGAMMKRLMEFRSRADISMYQDTIQNMLLCIDDLKIIRPGKRILGYARFYAHKIFWVFKIPHSS